MLVIGVSGIVRHTVNGNPSGRAAAHGRLVVARTPILLRDNAVADVPDLPLGAGGCTTQVNHRHSVVRPRNHSGSTNVPLALLRRECKRPDRRAAHEVSGGRGCRPAPKVLMVAHEGGVEVVQPALRIVQGATAPAEIRVEIWAAGALVGGFWPLEVEQGATRACEPRVAAAPSGRALSAERAVVGGAARAAPVWWEGATSLGRLPLTRQRLGCCRAARCEARERCKASRDGHLEYSRQGAAAAVTTPGGSKAKEGNPCHVTHRIAPAPQNRPIRAAAAARAYACACAAHFDQSNQAHSAQDRAAAGGAGPVSPRCRPVGHVIAFRTRPSRKACRDVR